MQRRCLILLSTLLLIVGFLFAQDLPQPVGWVNDFANVISAEHKEKLTSLIQELEEKTSAEITVVTINSITPYGEIEYARMLFDNWKPGKKGKDNGVLVFLAIKERRWRIETGYGIEGILPDGLCGEIGRNYMVPYFKEARFAEGLYRGVAAIAGVIAKNANLELNGLEEPGVTEAVNKASFDRADIIFLIIVLILIIKLSLIILVSIPRKRNRYGRDSAYSGWGYGGGSWGGGGFGGGGFGGGGGGGGGAGGGF
jgi:uncharacterized protein